MTSLNYIDTLTSLDIFTIA